MRAAFLAVGSELLGTDRLDTNSLRVTETLERFGVELSRKSIVSDDRDDIVRELRFLSESVDLVVVSGGLGPTRDDLTREAVAALVGRPLVFDSRVSDSIEAMFRSFGRAMPEVNRRQAMVIEGAAVLDNPNGTAPGLRVDHERVTLFLFPGVPRELDALVVQELEPWLEARLRERGEESVGIAQVEFRVACLPESTVEERIAEAYERFGAEAISVLAKPAEIRVRVRAPRSEPAELERRVDVLRRLLGDAMFSQGDPPEELEETVGRLLLGAGQTVVTCESCTGGLVAERLTSVPGSSAWFLGGVVTYTNELKHQLLGVETELFSTVGAVSPEVALSMATGGRERLGADWALSITGIAGPDGGSEDKPVGTVDFGIAGAEAAFHERRRFPGGRERVRRQASQFSLELLRRSLLGLPLVDRIGR